MTAIAWIKKQVSCVIRLRRTARIVVIVAFLTGLEGQSAIAQTAAYSTSTSTMACARTVGCVEEIGRPFSSTTSKSNGASNSSATANAVAGRVAAIVTSSSTPAGGFESDAESTAQGWVKDRIVVSAAPGVDTVSVRFSMSLGGNVDGGGSGGVGSSASAGLTVNSGTGCSGQLYVGESLTKASPTTTNPSPKTKHDHTNLGTTATCTALASPDGKAVFNIQLSVEVRASTYSNGANSATASAIFGGGSGAGAIVYVDVLTPHYAVDTASQYRYPPAPGSGPNAPYGPGSAAPSGVVSAIGGDGVPRDRLGTSAEASGVDYVPGKVLDAFRFNDPPDASSTLDIVRIPHRPALQPGAGSFSAVAWIATHDGSDFQTILAKSEGAGRAGDGHGQYFLYVTPGDRRLMAWLREAKLDQSDAPVAQSVTGNTPVGDGVFHHVAMVRDVSAGQLRLYVDGSLDVAVPLTSGADGFIGEDPLFPNSDSDPLTIGAIDAAGTAGPSRGFHGLIDDVVLYNRALTSLELTNLAASEFLGVFGSVSPMPEWIDQRGGVGYDTAEDVAHDSITGHTFVTGYSFPVWTRDTPNPYNYAVDGWLKEYDREGALVWSTEIATPQHDMVSSVAVAGSNLCVAGSTNGTLGDPHDDHFDGFVRCFDIATKAVKWTRQLATYRRDDFLDVALAPVEGAVYVIGHVFFEAGRQFGDDTGAIGHGSRDGVLQKYRLSDGTLLWTRFIGSPGQDSGQAVAVTPDGMGIYVLGNTFATIEPDGQAIPSSESYQSDGYIRRYRPDGTVEWTRQFGTGTSDHPFGLATDASGVYLLGWTFGVMPGQVDYGVGGSDMFVRKYSHGGGEAWTRQFGTLGDDMRFEGVSVDATGTNFPGFTNGFGGITAADGAIFVAGSANFRTPTDMPPTWAGGSTNESIRRLDATTGRDVWVQGFGTPGSPLPGTDFARGLAADNMGAVYVAGRTNGAPAGWTNAGDYDVYLAKLSADTDGDGLTDVAETQLGGIPIRVQNSETMNTVTSSGTTGSGSVQINTGSLAVTLPQNTTVDPVGPNTVIIAYQPPTASQPLPAVSVQNAVLPTGTTKSIAMPIGSGNLLCITDKPDATISSGCTSYVPAPPPSGTCPTLPIGIVVPSPLGATTIVNTKNQACNSVAYTVTRTGAGTVLVGGLHHSAVELAIDEPPTVAAGGPYSVVEGGTVMLVASGSDPEGTALTYTWDLDHDGTFETSGDAVEFSAAGLEGPGTAPVTVRACDAFGSCGTVEADVAVANAAPVIDGVAGPVGPLAVGAPVFVSADFADGGESDSFSCTVAWDDGLSSNGTASGTGTSHTCSASHTYAAAGVYTVGVAIQDDDGGATNATYEFAVIYDPAAGHVSGGGWIQSPAGAYAANPSAGGKATFGFVSRYRPGNNVPDGNTEFQLHFAGFRFKSTSYEWLVVSGAKAQYRGFGTVNGAGSYGFRLTATDGDRSGGDGIDKFRISIWDHNHGNDVVYDNAAGSNDLDESPQQAIGGGSIVIHK